jgi:DNA 3'-phosphatase
MWNSIVGCEYYISNDFDINTDKFIKSPKFALFDMDKTLITPKNARNPYTLHLDPDSSNFILLGDESEIYGLFQSLKAKNYIIAIVTNQSRFTDLLFKKIENFRKTLEVNLGWSPYIFIGTNKKYAKPSTGTFKLLCKTLKIDYNNLNVDYLRRLDKGLPNFFMVGDASGKEDPFPPYRYSSTDRDFARNLSLLLSKSYTVCQYVRPIDIFGSKEVIGRKEQELVITVGNPGC